jgi:hypothetical protein
MPGVKGAGGPPPKRSDQRRRRNTPAGGAPTKAAKGKQAVMPAADSSWHPVARQWYESLAGSGQGAFYEQSDWATAYVLAESMSREFSPQPVVDKDGNVTMVSFPPKGASLAAWLRGMTSLLATEGDRRRAALELGKKPGAADEPSDEGGTVSSLDAWRARTDGTG